MVENNNFVNFGRVCELVVDLSGAVFADDLETVDERCFTDFIRLRDSMKIILSPKIIL